MIKFILFLFLFFVIQINNSYAYLDPGTGSFILQAIIGFIAAGLATVTLYWNKFKNFITKLFKKKNKEN
tara:strand:+ start:303 stop:509 length:207 start_codon:yes stop_codon:yes gene_type:complete